MDFKDISERMKKANKDQEAQNPANRPYDYDESYLLRSKMLGVLIRDARLNAARTSEDCARLLNVDVALVDAWEYGDQVPSLPQLELLAYYLDVPVSHFWGQRTLDNDRDHEVSAQGEYMNLRHRMIGALLRQARETTGKSLEDVSAASHIPVEVLQQYELGEVEIPMNHLTMLSNLVNRNMDYFLETSSYVGELLRIREEWKLFTDLDPEIRQFAANPLNIGFMKIAITFSRMSAEQLRQAAEGMLEIAM